MRIGRIVLFAVVGLSSGAIGGLLLPSFRGRQTLELGLSSLTHLAVLGAFVASAGPLIERHWRKLFANCIAGAVGLILLVLGVMGIAQWKIGGFFEILVIVAAAALFPAIVALADCLADKLYRGILYETTFAALGGVVGFACAWPMLFLQNPRTKLTLAVAIYSGVIWFMMGIAKWEEQSEEKIESEELSEDELSEDESESA